MRSRSWCLVIAFAAALTNPCRAVALAGNNDQAVAESAKVAATQTFSVNGQVAASEGFKGTLTLPDGSMIKKAPALSKGGPWECTADAKNKEGNVTVICKIGSWVLCMLTSVSTIGVSEKGFSCSVYEGGINDWTMSARSAQGGSVTCKVHCFNLVNE